MREIVCRDNHNLKGELLKYCNGEADLPIEKQGVARSSLSKLWGDVALIIMHFITLDTSNVWVRSFHFSFLNHLKGHRMNISTFLYAKLDKAVDDFKKSKGNEVEHQGLILIIFKHVAKQMGVSSSFQSGIGEDGKIGAKVDPEGGPGKKMKPHSKEGDWKMACVARKSSHIQCDK